MSQDKRNALICTICMENYSRPKRLIGCHHSYCLLCIVKEANGSTFFRCPDCDALSYLGNAGPEVLEDNSELSAAGEVQDNKMEVSICSHWKPSSKSYLCAHCNFNFCESCAVDHSKMVRTEIDEMTEELWLPGVLKRKVVESVENAVADVIKFCDLLKKSIDIRQNRILTVAAKAREAKLKQMRGAYTPAMTENTLNAMDFNANLEDLSKSYKAVSELVSTREELPQLNEHFVLSFEHLFPEVSNLKLVHDADIRYSWGADDNRNQLTTDGDANPAQLTVSTVATPVLQPDTTPVVSPVLLAQAPPPPPAPPVIFPVPAPNNVVWGQPIDSAVLAAAVPFLANRQVMNAAAFSDENQRLEQAKIQLINGILNGNLDVVRYLFELYPWSPASKTRLMMTTQEVSHQICYPIHLACFKKHLHIVRFLVDGQYNGLLFKTAVKQFTCAHIAATTDDLIMLQYVLDRQKSLISEKNSAGNTPLHVAAHRGNLASVKFLLEQGADINALNNYGQSVLHSACDHDVANFLLERSPDLAHIKDNRGQLPGSLSTASKIVCVTKS